jgi:hypothetical protein
MPAVPAPPLGRDLVIDEVVGQSVLDDLATGDNAALAYGKRREARV